jgi:hypothetical protein
VMTRRTAASVGRRTTRALYRRSDHGIGVGAPLGAVMVTGCPTSE